jgi:hypothetical protein
MHDSGLMRFAIPFIMRFFHPLHLAGFGRRTETIEEKRGVSIALSAIARSVKTKRIRSMQGDDAALVRIVSPRFAEIVSR